MTKRLFSIKKEFDEKVTIVGPSLMDLLLEDAKVKELRGPCVLYRSDDMPDLVVKQYSQKMLWTLKKEAVMVSKVECLSGVIHMLGACPERTQLLFYYEGRDLQKLLKKTKMSLFLRVNILLRVFRTVENIHGLGFAHNSLKLANVCYHEKKRTVHVIDFAEMDVVGRPVWKWAKD